MNRRRRTERGTMALEMAILAPILLLMFMFLMACGRYFQTSSLLENAAREGARAATQSRSASDAQARVERAVKRYGGQAVESCKSTIDGSIDGKFEAGQSLTVKMTCTIDYQDLGLLGIGGDTTVSRSFTSSIDPYRGVRDGP